MRDYAQVRPTLWTGETGRALRGHVHAQLVRDYLITCGSSNIAGLYYLPLPTLCHDTGISLEGAREGLARLSEAEFAHYDEPTSYVWVVNAARENVGTNPNLADNRVLGVRREVERHAKCPFYAAFVQHYAALFQSPIRSVTPGKTKAPKKPLRSASGGGGGSGDGDGDGERAGERERGRDLARAPAQGFAPVEMPDAEVLSASHLRDLFRTTWMAAGRADPPLPDESVFATLAERVTTTAGPRSVPPAELFTATLDRWARSELNDREKRSPVHCFAQAFGEVVDQVVSGSAPSAADQLSRQSGEALRNGDMDRYESLQSQLRALNGRGHAAASR